MDSIINVYLQYGVLGIACVVLAKYILYIHKEHKSERSEWKETWKESYDKNTDATTKNTTIVAELKTLLKSIEGRIK